MGATYPADIPNNVSLMTGTVISRASDAATSTSVIGRVPYYASVVACHILPTASGASVANKNAGLSLINLGSAGTGTTVLGSLLGTVAYASWTPLALTLAGTPTVTAGDVIGLSWASASSTTITPGGSVTLHLTYI